MSGKRGAWVATEPQTGPPRRSLPRAVWRGVCADGWTLTAAVTILLLLTLALFAAVLIIGANFVVDLLYGVLDPRVRLS